MRKYLFSSRLSVVAILGGYIAYHQAGGIWLNMWLTPGQQYQRLMNQQRYEDAAAHAVDPLQKGTALYMAGKFKEAASVYGAISSAEALYNRANSYVMQGMYGEAIAGYERVLQQRPDWPEARDNMALAKLRKEKMAPPEDDAGGTGGQLGADKIVFDDRNMNKASASNEPSQSGGLSQNEQLALWLRKVETKPADFLRLKFSYQLSRQEK